MAAQVTLKFAHPLPMSSFPARTPSRLEEAHKLDSDLIGPNYERVGPSVNTTLQLGAWDKGIEGISTLSGGLLNIPVFASMQIALSSRAVTRLRTLSSGLPMTGSLRHILNSRLRCTSPRAVSAVTSTRLKWRRRRFLRLVRVQVYRCSGCS